MGWQQWQPELSSAKLYFCTMATGPTIPNDPIELLTYDPTRVEPFINKYWAAGLCGTLSFVAICFGKYSTKRPVFSGKLL